MEKQNKWQYCNETTRGHCLSKKYSQCLERIHDIIVTEGGKNPPFSDEVALNLDAMEIVKSKAEHRNRNSTMDMAFGIRNGNSRQMVLCEYRLRYRNEKNISKSEIDSKIAYSRILIGIEPPIHNFYLFIFPTNIKQQAIHTLRRTFANKPNYVAMGISDLKENYFDS